MPAVTKKVQKRGHEHEPHWTFKYGEWFGPIRDVNGRAVAPKPDYMIEISCFMSCMGWSKNPPPSESPGDWEECQRGKIHSGASYHFMKLADFFFSDPAGIFFFQWNPFATQMLEDKIRCPILGVAGAASTGKTEFGVVWGMLNYLMAPKNTKVLVGSTTKAAAKGKVWGSVTNAWYQIQRKLGEANMPGKLLGAQDKIVYQQGKERNTKAGIELVAGAASEEAESAEKVQGYKQDRVFFIADEFATMSHGLWHTIKTNLFKNPLLDFIGMFNPDSFYDVAGLFSKPKHILGWDSVNVETEFYESEEGFIRHLDGEKSPNKDFITGQEKWKGLLTYDKLEKSERDAGGKNTKGYYQMVRGWWSPTGTLDTIFTESEIVKYLGDHEVADWDSPPTPVCGFDPSFTHGGDLSVAVFGLCGWVTDKLTRKRMRVFQMTEIVVLVDDLHSNEPKVEQIVRMLIKHCREKKVDPKHLAMDETGGGIALGALIARDWSNDFLRVQFGGRATDTPISKDNPKPASEEYANRVTELWYSGKPLLRSGQLKGLKPDVIIEMSARTYHKRGGKIAVEAKEDMKSRTNGKSPDRSDGLFLAVDVCRQRLGLSSTETPTKFLRNQTRLSPMHAYLSGQNQKSQQLFDWGQSLRY